MRTSVRLAPLFALLVLLAVHPIPAAAVETEELQILEEPGYVPTPEEEMLPAEYRPQIVFFRTTEGPGTIIVHTQERFLYLVQGGDRAIRYGVGVGRDGFQWQGLAQNIAQAGMARLAAAAGDDPAPALSAALHGRRAWQSDGRARALSRRDGLSHPRHQPAADDRPRRLVRAASAWSTAM